MRGYYGFEFIEAPSMTYATIVQNRRHRQKRINKKWLKKYGYKVVTKPKLEIFVLQAERKIIGHPETIKKIIKCINEQ